MQIEAALDRYLCQLEADGRSQHTKDQYRRHIALLAGWMGKALGTRDAGALTHEHLARFLTAPEATRTERGELKQPASLNALRSSLRAFFAYCEAAGYVERSPARLVRRALVGPRLPRALRSGERERLTRALVGAEGRAAERDRLLVALMLETGIRLSSALSIDVGDVDLDGRGLELRFVKRGQQQRVALPEGLVDALRAQIGDRQRGPLFLGATGKRLGQRQAQRRLKGWALAAGAPGLTAHALRHTFATEHYQKGRDILSTSRALGHCSINSTLVYTRVTAG